jgi:hypothetical protein
VGEEKGRSANHKLSGGGGGRPAACVGEGFGAV